MRAYEAVAVTDVVADAVTDSGGDAWAGTLGKPSDMAGTLRLPAGLMARTSLSA
ncbi:hypothetical protein GCM10022233_74390 [Streptomyces shaanxiensis]|uniref:Uncharacterized protein n=1 Tax=Streptomyces shaanxiensis TaxID=653357 RepID=A0ABP7W6P7_9ACTN